MLVTQMRGVKLPSSRGEKATHTFFDSFGLQVRTGKKVGLSFDRVIEEKAIWKPIVTIDGTSLKKNYFADDVKVIMNEDGRIFVTTDQHRFIFQAVHQNGYATHRFDFNMNLIGDASQTADYTGILGFTLNNVLGREVHPDLDVSARESCDLEAALRERFQVDSLFPEKEEEVTLPVVARINVKMLQKKSANYAAEGHGREV